MKTHTHRSLLAALIAAVTIAVGLVVAGEKEGSHKEGSHSDQAKATVTAGAQAHCPIMGGKISKQVHADHDGKRVYFCCPGCIKKFQADPDKYLRKMAASGAKLATVAKAQATCPMMLTGKALSAADIAACKAQCAKKKQNADTQTKAAAHKAHEGSHKVPKAKHGDHKVKPHEGSHK